MISVILRHHRGETHSQAVNERVLLRPRANNSQQSRGRHSSDGLRRIFLWGRGPAGEGWGESGARPRPGARDIAKMKREEERMERVDGKAAGDHGLYSLPEGSAWQMGRAPTPYQTQRAVRAATGSLNRKA
jgi:hypothetical protein